MKNLIFALFAILLFTQCHPEQEVNSITGQAILKSYQVNDDLGENAAISDRNGTNTGTAILDLGLDNLSSAQQADISAIYISIEARDNYPFEWNLYTIAGNDGGTQPSLINNFNPNLPCTINCRSRTWSGSCANGDILIELVCAGPKDGSYLEDDNGVVYTSQLTKIQGMVILNSGIKIPITFPSDITVY